MDNHDRKPRSGRAINRREFLAMATRVTGAAMALGATSSFAQPAAAYPTKPIRLIIGFSAGGALTHSHDW